MGGNESKELYRTSEFPHFVVEKDKDQRKTLKKICSLQKDVVEEFNKADEKAKAEALRRETTAIAKSPENEGRNRYIDIVPFDSNIVSLSINTGNPPSTYVNASHIRFSTARQAFIAIQAPNPDMIGSFWQLVWEQDVKVIVMITDLMEGGRIMAHQYWPDKSTPEKRFDEVGITVTYESHSYIETFYHRRIILRHKEKGGKVKKRKIDQIQTVEWRDMTAPETTKVLLDTLYQTQELMEDKTGPIMVHCSTGVGRTATYIGLYKLVDDYSNKEVKKIDFFATLMEMRDQRMMMIQKPLQYYYMVQCLRDYVENDISVYS